MAKKISVINIKGGVGKTTVTVNLAHQFAGYPKWAKRVLVVDLDPQFNASQYLIGVTAYEKILNQSKPTVWNVFEQFTQTPGSPGALLKPADVIQRAVTYFNPGKHIDLIPSRLELAYSLRNPSQKEELLKKLIEKIEGDYDIILFDCPPTESVLTTAAYMASEHVLAPVAPEYLSSIGVSLLYRSLQDFQQRYEVVTPVPLGIVFNATDNYAPEEVKSKAEVRKLAKGFGWYVFQNDIKYSRSYPKGAREGKPIFSTSYRRTERAKQFHDFAEEFATRLGI